MRYSFNAFETNSGIPILVKKMPIAPARYIYRGSNVKNALNTANPMRARKSAKVPAATIKAASSYPYKKCKVIQWSQLKSTIYHKENTVPWKIPNFGSDTSEIVK